MANSLKKDKDCHFRHLSLVGVAVTRVRGMGYLNFNLRCILLGYSSYSYSGFMNDRIQGISILKRTLLKCENGIPLAEVT